jgi:hypothetical protein
VTSAQSRSFIVMSVRESLAAAFIVAFAFSLCISLVRTGIATERSARDAKQQSPSERRHEVFATLDLHANQYDQFRSHLRHRERYAVVVRGKRAGRWRKAALEAPKFAAFYFLPAIQEDGSRVVFHYKLR